MPSTDTVVLRFDAHTVPRPLRGLPVVPVPGPAVPDDAIDHRRLIVVGHDADLAAVLTQLMRKDRLDVQVGFVAPRRSPATRALRLPPGRLGARRARRGSPRRIPLIRDDAGIALVGQACWRGAGGALYGQAVVDDTVLFDSQVDGEVSGVWIEPTVTLPGVRATVHAGPMQIGPMQIDRAWPRRWIPGRAVQLGTTGAVVFRDGVPGPRMVRRSTFYRHTEGWLLVR